MSAFKDLAYSLVATAPSPASSGTSLVVTAGQGSSFPSVPFIAIICPAGSLPTNANAEKVLVTAVSTDTFTITRAYDTSSARTVVVGDQIFMGPFAKVLRDALDNSVCDGRLTLTSVTPVTTADVTAATTLYFTPYKGNRIALFDGTNWFWDTFSEISIAVPATTSQMYDVFAFDNAGTVTLELLAWTNDTTRATALVKQDGVLVKSGATTRRYLGSVRTTTVSGQTEDSLAKRYVWNYYNRVKRVLRRIETTNTWTYTTATFRQANASTANQVDVVVGVAEVPIDLRLAGAFDTAQAVGTISASVSIGEDSTTTPATGASGGTMNNLAGGNNEEAMFCNLVTYPAIGRHFYAWLEKSTAVGTTTWYGQTSQGLSGSIDG